MRTELQVYDDFRKLGWYPVWYDYSPNTFFDFYSKGKPYYSIEIDKACKSYRVFCYNSHKRTAMLPLAEHKLLHELFEIWGWFDKGE